MPMATHKKRKIVFVAMSGGVDSSVAAGLLLRRGHRVIGVHLRCWNVDGCAEQDAEDAGRAAETLGIPFYVLDFEKEYRERVVEYMIEGYRRGITPNPDVMCNREIKFGLFFDRARAMGADYVATGHYVQIKKSKIKNQNDKSKFENTYSLFEAKDKNKDQSYFLWTLTQDQLKHCLFPIGDYLKSEVRVMARKFDLPNAEKKDSQGICFLGKVTLSDFLRRYLPERRGFVYNGNGKKVGVHRGAHLYTIGQRHGIGISGREPHYVAAKDVKRNTLIAVPAGDALLSRKDVDLYGVRFISGASPRVKRIFVRVRYRQPLISAELHSYDGIKKSAALTFGDPQLFVAEGQSAVFYTGKGEMVGGGIIG